MTKLERILLIVPMVDGIIILFKDLEAEFILFFCAKAKTMLRQMSVEVPFESQLVFAAFAEGIQT